MFGGDALHINSISILQKGVGQQVGIFDPRVPLDRNVCISGISAQNANFHIVRI